MYADDLVVLCQDLPVAQRVLTLIYDIGKAMGINVSLKKTKLMRLSSRLWENNEGKKIKSALYNHISESMEVSVGDVKIEKMEKFCYLRHMMAKDGCAVISDATIKYRKGQERSEIARIKPLFKVCGSISQR